MATNFRISSQRNSDSLHLELIGDFDGTSAYELVNFMEKHCKSACKVFIHTNRLEAVYPYACNVFRSHFTATRDQYKALVFTGENAEEIALQ
jgi:hypothetical protein